MSSTANQEIPAAKQKQPSLPLVKDASPTTSSSSTSTHQMLHSTAIREQHGSAAAEVSKVETMRSSTTDLDIPTATQPSLPLTVKEDDWWVKHWVGSDRPFGNTSSSSNLAPIGITSPDSDSTASPTTGSSSTPTRQMVHTTATQERHGGTAAKVSKVETMKSSTSDLEIPIATQPSLPLTVKEDDWWVKHWVGSNRPFSNTSSGSNLAPTGITSPDSDSTASPTT